MRSATIYDVAREAGVSMKTVSRVMNGEPHVREVLRERVNDAVIRLGYRPNTSARALASSRSFLLSAFFNNPNFAYISYVEHGALMACREHGYHLIVETLSGPVEPEAIGGLLDGVKTDGVILTPPLTDDPVFIEALRKRKIPFVQIAPAPEAPPAGHTVSMDDYSAAYEMTRHLQELGHTDIAIIAGPPEHSAAGRRFDGWMAAMTERGLPTPEDLRPAGDFSFKSGLDAAEGLLKRPNRPTAIFASNDDMALGVMAMAHRLGLDVPRQLSIAGFDDSPSAQVVWPQLTTVRQPVAEMAQAAADILIGLRGPAPHDLQKRQMDFEIVVRGSTAPPAER